MFCESGSVNGMHWSVASDVGQIRQRNEDNFLVMPERNLFAVADGMGGHTSGDLASRICVETLFHFFRDDRYLKTLQELWNNADSSQRQAFPSVDAFIINRAIEASNQAIFDTAQANRHHRSMGTTLVVMKLDENQLNFGYVGDSRLYRSRGKAFEQLSYDHSLANEYLRLNMIREEDVHQFQYKNVILRALGLNDEVKSDSITTELIKGDRYLLCTDGLTDLVPDDEIRECFCQDTTPDDVAKSLIDLANETGGFDNITVMVVDT